MAVEPKYMRVIDLLKGKLLAEFGSEVHSIVLFGSVARGEATADSDIDVLIVTDGDSDTKRRAHDISSEIDFDNEVLTQLVSLTIHQFEKEVRMRSWFSSDVIAQGVILHDDGTYQRIRETHPAFVAGVPGR